MSAPRPRLSMDELEQEAGTLLPAKEVMSLLDLNIDADLALALAAPIDLAVAANANVAAPIDAAVSANVLSALSSATGLANQEVLIDQVLSGEAIATAPQDASIAQPDAGDAGTAAAAEPATGTADAAAALPVDGGAIVDDAVTAADPLTGSLEGGLLNVDVNVALDADLAAPIAGAVAANANVAAPIDAAVAANIGSIGSDATAVADQTALITQHLDGVTAEATADQQADITQ